METHEGFSKFKSLAASLKSSFQIDNVATSSRAPLTLDELQAPKFFCKGKTDKKTTNKTMPTMLYVLSGAEHREVISLKE